MSVHSVPCWCCLDKDVAVLGSGSIWVRFTILFLSHDALTSLLNLHGDFNRSPWSPMAFRKASVKPNPPLLEQHLRYNGLISLQLLLLPLSIHFTKWAAHFRWTGCAPSGDGNPFFGQDSGRYRPENGTKTLINGGKIQLLHRCALSGDGVRAFERRSARFRGTECALSRDVFTPNLL